MEVNQIICGDNIQVMKTLPDDCIDLTVTSPPYDNLRDYQGYTFDFEAVARQLWRVTKEGGVVVWVVGDATINGSETGTSFRQALYFMEVGFNLHDTMIYERPARFPDTKRYYAAFEYMFIFSKQFPTTVNLINDKKNTTYGDIISGNDRQKDGRLTKKSCSGRKIKQFGVRNNIWKFYSGYMLSTKNKNAFKHPAIFPERLAQDHIISWSNKGDLILDPFCGSGTTCKMARENHRDFIGIEISKEYCKIANQRINNAQLSLF